MRLRKILMVASVTFACVAQAQDLTIHVNKKGKVGFVDKNGAEVIKCAYERCLSVFWWICDCN